MSAPDDQHPTSPRKRRILFAMDGSDSAEESFKWFVDTMYSKGDYVIMVYTPEYKGLIHMPVMTCDVNLVNRMVEEEQKNIKLMMAKFHEIMHLAGVEGTVKQLPGDPGDQICTAAEKEGADFIVTGSRGLGKIRRTLLGSVSKHVLHHSSVPVLICRQNHGHEHHGRDHHGHDQHGH